MKNEIVAAILSGGKNSRMDYKTKAFLTIEGQSFIERILNNLKGFKEVVISCNDFPLYEQFKDHYKLIGDIKKDIGPIGGIYSVFKKTNGEKIFVVAADMPFINSDIVDSICSIDFEGDALVVSSNGKVEPLFAIYKNSILDKLEKQIAEGNYKLMNLLNSVKTSYFYVDKNKGLENINTTVDYLNINKGSEKGTRIINVIGSCSNTGKTTLIEGIIKELKKQNYTVSTIKHDVHGFDIDKEGKDSYKHRMAGADNVSISSKNRFALIRELSEELTIEEIVKNNPKTDFIIIEGYKKSNFRKIEVFREGLSKNIITDKDKLIAVATDSKNLSLDDVSIVGINDYKSIVKLMEKEGYIDDIYFRDNN